MFYPTYDDYMRDVFYFNGLANNGMGCWNNPNTGNNLNDFYPSIYRIVFPVVQRVVSAGNFQIVNEDAISNAVETIYGIVEGDINQTQSVSGQNNQCSSNNNANSNNCNGSNNSTRVSNNLLLKDLIRILIIRELISRNNVRRFPCNNQPYFMNQPMMPMYQM